MATLNFDSSQVAPAVAPEAIPAGWYQGFISETEMKNTAANNGSTYLSLELTVMGGQFHGHKLWDRINMANANPVAVRIGQEQLSAVCHATGVIQVQDSAQLHNRPMMFKVSLRPAGAGADGKYYDANNEVKGYKKLEGGPAAGQAPAAPMMPPVAPAPVAWAPPPAPVAAPAQQQWAPPAPIQQPAPTQVAPQWAPQQAPVQQAPVQQAPVVEPVQQAPVQQPAWAAVPPAPAPTPEAAPVQQAAPAAPAATPPWAQAPAQ